MLESGPNDRVWMQLAACAGMDPDMFFDRDMTTIRQAKAICAQCPVETACLEYAIEHNERGIWGGTTTNDRGEIKWLRRNKTDLKRRPR